MKIPSLKLSLIDMNNGVANEATRCFRRILDSFQNRVRAANPGLEISLQHVQPRNLGELPERNVDLVLSSGGPGAPSDGAGEPWFVGYCKFLDRVVERNLRSPAGAPAIFTVCHSFEIAILHFGVARIAPRQTLKFGVMPAYPTLAGTRSALFAPFGDRLFVWEHRKWQAVDLDERRLSALGGAVLATESRPGRADKGRALLAFQFAPGVSGTQFHPEADRLGVLAWIDRPEHSAALQDAYGNSLYERMMKTLADPSRLARTYALLVPGWLTAQFNRLALERGWRSLSAPVQDFQDFEQAGRLAV